MRKKESIKFKRSMEFHLKIYIKNRLFTRDLLRKNKKQ